MKYTGQETFASYFAKPCAVVLLIAGIFSIIWLRSSVTTLEYSISELENRKMENLREAKMLLAEKASLLSMYKVEKTAMRNLGLVFPDRRKVVYVKPKESGPYKVSYVGRGNDPAGKRRGASDFLSTAQAKSDLYGGEAR